MGDLCSTEAFVAFAEKRVTEGQKIPAAQLHKSAVKWCRDAGKPAPAVGKTLAAVLRRRGWRQQRTGQCIVWSFSRPRVVDAATAARADEEAAAILLGTARPAP